MSTIPRSESMRHGFTWVLFHLNACAWLARPIKESKFARPRLNVARGSDFVDKLPGFYWASDQHVCYFVDVLDRI